MSTSTAQNFFVKDTDPTWNGATTLEDTIRAAFALGTEAELVKLLESLPEASRAKYRAVWLEESKKRKETT